MPASWKYGSSRSSHRGNMTDTSGGNSNNGGGVSAIYAAASGMHPPPSERKKAEPAVKRLHHKNPTSLATATPFLSSWLPQRLGKFDRPVELRESDALPELLEGVFERNRALASGNSRPSGNQSAPVKHR
ncbi:uncharacterized protein KRP23_289 [Globisporangium polare]